MTTYVKKRFGFDSVEAFEAHLRELERKAAAYDALDGGAADNSPS